jgi:hypothetical protein
MDNEGEGNKITPIVETKTDKVEQKFSPEVKEKVYETLKQPVQKKFLGLSKWVWFVAGAIVIFAILTIVIVVNAH